MPSLQPDTLYHSPFGYTLRPSADLTSALIGLEHHFWYDGKIGTAIELRSAPFTPSAILNKASTLYLLTTLNYLDEYDHSHQKDVFIDIKAEVLALYGGWNAKDNELAFDVEGKEGWVARVTLGTRGLGKEELMDEREFEVWEKKKEEEEEEEEDMS
ncbi:hypothetical protein MMC18_006761 [Xylographa bjoerkii]|nr:hypothetical protein [Xylographa bjoerkii]